MHKIAAIQLETRIGKPEHNIALAERMAVEAATKGAQIIALPEFFTSAIAPDERAYAAVLARANDAVDMLQRVAREHGVWIGGSMLLEDGGDIYNRYVFAEPSGALHEHDKDLPTMWENAFYIGGSDDGCWETEIGGVGAAVCWELIREQTVARLRGRVGLVMSGTHWWTVAENWPGFGASRGPLAALAQRNKALSEQAPAELAKRLGAPVVQASHCGQFSGDFGLFAGSDLSLPYSTRFVGATQIVDASGKVLASRNTEEGPGIVYHSLKLGVERPSAASAEDRFWIPELPWIMRRYWDQQNWVGRSVYRRRGRAAGLEAAHESLNRRAAKAAQHTE